MISDRVLAQVRRSPDAVALVTDGTANGRVMRWSYAELGSFLLRMRARLQGLPGDEAVVLEAAPDAPSVAALLALEGMGYSVILVSPSLPPHEMRDIVRNSGAAVVLSPPSRLASTAAAIGAVGHEPAEGLHLLRVEQAHGRCAGPAHCEEGCLVQMTSGSLGASRLAMRPYRGVMIELEMVAERLGLRRGTPPAAGPSGQERILCASSIAHSYGCMAGLLAPLCSGAAVALAGDADSARALAAATRPGVVVGLATTYQTILGDREAGHALRRSRVALSAGAPLPPGLFEACMARLSVPIRQDYGTTETGTIAIDVGGEAAPHSVGLPLDHMQVRLVPPHDQPLEPGEAGEILVRSGAVASHYLVDGHCLPATDEEGWYRTHDVGAFDTHRRLVVGRRLRSPIQLPHGSVRPETLERVIGGMPGVKEVVILPELRDTGSNPLKAVIVAPGIRRETIRDWCRSRLAPDHIPAVIELRDQLPRSPAGKILQKYLVGTTRNLP